MQVNVSSNQQASESLPARTPERVQWPDRGLNPDGLRLRRGRPVAMHRHGKVYSIRCLLYVLEQPALNIRDEDVDKFLTLETCRNPAAKDQRFTRRVLIFYRLGYCRRALPLRGCCGQGQTTS